MDVSLSTSWSVCECEGKNEAEWLSAVVTAGYLSKLYHQLLPYWYRWFTCPSVHITYCVLGMLLLPSVLLKCVEKNSMYLLFNRVKVSLRIIYFPSQDLLCQESSINNEHKQYKTDKFNWQALEKQVNTISSWYAIQGREQKSTYDAQTGTICWNHFSESRDTITLNNSF